MKPIKLRKPRITPEPAVYSADDVFENEVETRVEKLKNLVGKYIAGKGYEYNGLEWKAWFELYKIYQDKSGEKIRRGKWRSYLRNIIDKGWLETLEEAARKLSADYRGIESVRERTLRFAREALLNI
jgi:hypothetical protein